GDAFHLHSSERTQFEIALDQPSRRFAHNDRATRRHRLQARGKISCMANGRVLDFSARLDCAHYHFTRMDAEARFELKLSAINKTSRVFTDLLLHLQCSVEPTLRMILVSGRGPEEGEDAVAGGLHYVTFVAAHRLDHDSERGIDNRPSFFRVKRLHQFGRAL